MKAFIPTLVLTGCVLAGSPTNNFAQDNPDKSAEKPAIKAQSDNREDSKPDQESKEAAKPGSHALPKAMEDIAKMSEAGLSAEVLTRFIENSGLAYEPSSADLIEMKRRGVPEDALVVMLARSSKLKAEYEATRRRVAAPAIVRTLATDGEIDPESYEFFWYHYAYPRALKGAYQELAPYAPYSQPRLYYRASSGPKWRTDGFASESLRPHNRADRKAIRR